MITVVAKLQAAPGKEAELRSVLSEMVANVKKHEAGAVPTYSLHVSDSDPTLFCSTRRTAMRRRRRRTTRRTT